MMEGLAMQDDLVIQRPDTAATQPVELLLLFHGVGSSAEDLRPLSEVVADLRPAAWVISVRSPRRSGFGAGWQWFSVQGVTEQDRPARVAAAMPTFRERVGAWQRESGATPASTTLIGFSQGAIMALESTQVDGPALAGQVIAIAGRFAQPPRKAPAGAVVNLMHGEQDRVMPVGLAGDAQQQLLALGAQVTLDRFSGLGHGIDAHVVQAIARRLDEGAPEAL
jgi:phospholipase/carboxylesterase